MENPDPAAVVPSSDAGRDPWVGLRRHTSARIALGRTGGSQRTGDILDFRLSHARARDAVAAPFDIEGIAERFRLAGVATRRIATAVSDKKTYLVRPDLGRRLDEAFAALGARSPRTTAAARIIRFISYPLRC